MIAIMIFVTGAAVALAFFHLWRGLFGFSPEFDRATVDQIGPVAAFAVYCCAGPVLLVRALGRKVPQNTALYMRNIVVFTFLILAWTCSLGIVAMESAKAVL